MKTKGLFCFLLVISLSFRIIAKPLVEEVTLLDKTSNHLEPSRIAHEKDDSKRVSRQSIRVLDPDYYDEVETLDPNRLRPAPPPVYEEEPPVLTYPQHPGIISTLIFGSKDNKGVRHGGLGKFLTGLLGSSSARLSVTDLHANRVRRQVEQIITRLQNSTNQTKERQENGVNVSMEDSVEQKEGGRSIEGNEESLEEDEPPGGGDGMGGGILGLIAGLSGEGGGSDLGTLLSTVGGVVANLSGGEGFDLNALIGSAVGLLGGILAGDGMKSIGTTISGYLITALDGITGGGAMNNGAFFGNLAAGLIAGTSAAGNPDDSSEGGGGGSDSGTFFLSLISALLGGSSG